MNRHSPSGRYVSRMSPTVMEPGGSSWRAIGHPPSPPTGTTPVPAAARSLREEVWAVYDREGLRNSTAVSGFVHHYRPLSAAEQAFVLTRHWPHLHLDDPEDFTTGEALAAVTRITGGSFRLTSRLVAQIERILEVNHL